MQVFNRAHDSAEAVWTAWVPLTFMSVQQPATSQTSNALTELDKVEVGCRYPAITRILAHALVNLMLKHSWSTADV